MCSSMVISLWLNVLNCMQFSLSQDKCVYGSMPPWFIETFIFDRKYQISITGCWLISCAPTLTCRGVGNILSILKIVQKRISNLLWAEFTARRGGGYVCLWLTALFSLPDGPCDAGGLDIGCAPHWLAFVSAVRHPPTPPLHMHRYSIYVSWPATSSASHLFCHCIVRDIVETKYLKLSDAVFWSIKNHCNKQVFIYI